MQRITLGHFLRLVLLIGLTHIAHFGFAQCNNSASFTGSLHIRPVSVGCVPLQINVSSDLPGVQNVRYVYEFDGLNEARTSSVPEYTYTKPGIYRILQLSEKDGRQLRACAVVEVQDTIQPAVNVAVCHREASLTIPRPGDYTYDYYVINWNDGQVDTVRTSPFARSHLYANDSIRRITVKGIHAFGNCGGTTVQWIEPQQPAQPPVLENPVADGGQVNFTVRNPNGVAIQLEAQYDNGDSKIIHPLTRQTSFSVSRPLPTTDRACARIIQVDPCYNKTAYPVICYEPQPIAPDTGWYLPTAFSPNDDGINETFGVVGNPQASGFRLAIYDRWGSVVFESNDPDQSWNGTTNGQAALPGPYYYRLAIWQANQPVRQRKGTVLLVR